MTINKNRWSFKLATAKASSYTNFLFPMSYTRQTPVLDQSCFGGSERPLILARSRQRPGGRPGPARTKPGRFALARKPGLREIGGCGRRAQSFQALSSDGGHLSQDSTFTFLSTCAPVALIELSFPEQPSRRDVQASRQNHQLVVGDVARSTLNTGYRCAMAGKASEA